MRLCRIAAVRQRVSFVTNPFAPVPPARRRLRPAACAGVLAGSLTQLMIISTAAIVRGEALSIADVADTLLVLGPGIVLLATGATLLVGWPSVHFLQKRGELLWWHVVGIGTGAGLLFSLVVWQSAFALTAVGAGALGGFAGWLVLGWPRLARRVAV